LMFSLPVENWLRLIIWLLLGFAIYFSYGRQHSALARMQTNINLADSASS
jgi:basic amino acid/polyamine antiporter, APA family